MRTAVLLAPLVTLGLLTSCDLITCEKPPQPRCTSGTVLRQTCMAGTLIQLHNSQEGQTIQLDLDGTGVKTYDHVVSTYTDLGALTQPGATLYFTLKSGGRGPELQCLAADAPAGMKRYTLNNLSAVACPEAAAND